MLERGRNDRMWDGRFGMEKDVMVEPDGSLASQRG